MLAYLIAQDGIFAGTLLTLDSEQREWIVGRDPDMASLLIEDPTVSRKHLKLSREGDTIIAENLSLVSPSRINGRLFEEPTALKEGDLLQIGTLSFTFTYENTESLTSKEAASDSEKEVEGSFSFFHPPLGRFVLKVISGSQVGAEFPLEFGKSYLLGKDPQAVDLCFYDVSISREHAKITLSEQGAITVEDLGSRNGTLLNGELLKEAKALEGGDLLTLGTTSILLIDREAIQETLYAPHLGENGQEAENKDEPLARKDWKELFIPTRHLVIALCFGAL